VSRRTILIVGWARLSPLLQRHAMAAEKRNDLIYDVGLFDGSDTAYYLHRGYYVVGIDANPIMIENAKARFAQQVQQGRLLLVNAGIAESAQEATFWISDRPEWSSFSKAIASRDGTRHQPFPVQIVPFADILKEYGVPHYIKIDIEGNDSVCVKALSSSELMPLYISVESECVGDDDDAVSDEQATAMLDALHRVGYHRFKLVNQYNWTATRPVLLSNYRVRLIESMAKGRLRATGLAKIASKFTDSSTIMRRVQFDFPAGATGPWGEDIPGPWMDLQQARLCYLRERRRHFSRGQRAHSFWHDWHATL
jgi:FkbM family methyltransferase